MKPALLIIDLQKHYYDKCKDAQPEMDKAIPYINWASELFRSKSLPVIAILHDEKQGVCTPGNPGFEMHPDIKLTETDIVIHKTHSNGFLETSLAEKLKELEVDTIILTGISTEYCILSTYKGAEAYPVTPILLRKGVASVDGNTDAVLKFTEHITCGALYRFLN